MNQENSIVARNASDLWNLLADLDAGIARSAEREAIQSRSNRRSTDAADAEYKLPLRMAQELAGKPIGFECTSVSWSAANLRKKAVG